MPVVSIHFKKEIHKYQLRRGLGFQALAAQQKTPLEFDCRKADCGICVIRVLKGQEHLADATLQEKEFLRAMHAEENERLACQCRLFGDVAIEVEDVTP